MSSGSHNKKKQTNNVTRTGTSKSISFLPDVVD